MRISDWSSDVCSSDLTMIKQLPPGATPPLILNYNASTVPIIQIALSGSGLSEQELADLGLNVVRTPLVTVPGAAIPYPYGGKTRQIQIDLDSSAMQARGLTGQDRSEEHTYELQIQKRKSYAVFCLKTN